MQWALEKLCLRLFGALLKSLLSVKLPHNSTPLRGRWRWGRRRTWWRPWWRGRRRQGRRAAAPLPPLPGWSGGQNKPQKLWPGLHTASQLLLLCFIGGTVRIDIWHCQCHWPLYLHLNKGSPKGDHPSPSTIRSTSHRACHTPPFNAVAPFVNFPSTVESANNWLRQDTF